MVVAAPFNSALLKMATTPASPSGSSPATFDSAYGEMGRTGAVSQVGTVDRLP